MAPAEDLHVEVTGSGPSVLLAHGFGGSARNFRPQVKALRGRYRAIVYDARGHARSFAPEAASEYTPECFVSDMERALGRAGAERAVVGGLSMGAGVALRFALAQPQRVQGLVLASFPAPASSGAGIAARADAFARALDEEGLEAAGRRFVWGESSGLSERDAGLVRQGFLEHQPRALAHVLRELIAGQPPVEELAAKLAGLQQPALIVAGEADAPSVATSRALAAALPKARLEIIPGAGHVVNLQRADAFNAALLGFLAKVFR
jgi:2-succinyl-6-hydroxy-2,4-cyclohexadiene-1-carboxylate synthase